MLKCVITAGVLAATFLGSLPAYAAKLTAADYLKEWRETLARELQYVVDDTAYEKEACVPDKIGYVACKALWDGVVQSYQDEATALASIIADASLLGANLVGDPAIHQRTVNHHARAADIDQLYQAVWKLFPGAPPSKLN